MSCKGSFSSLNTELHGKLFKNQIKLKDSQNIFSECVELEMQPVIVTFGSSYRKRAGKETWDDASQERSIGRAPSPGELTFFFICFDHFLADRVLLQTIEDMDLDSEKIDLINREIESFRNRHKVSQCWR